MPKIVHVICILQNLTFWHCQFWKIAPNPQVIPTSNFEFWKKYAIKDRQVSIWVENIWSNFKWSTVKHWELDDSVLVNFNCNSVLRIGLFELFLFKSLGYLTLRSLICITYPKYFCLLVYCRSSIHISLINAPWSDPPTFYKIQ